ncbi:MAG: alpha-L-rhamnosidase, partial [Clostridia bacterium]|nr:alpha-L-rhamnosidase [Clostridia bacterium]
LRLCVDTIRYGTQENYVDCPTREKGQYAGDVTVAGRAQATLTGDTTMMKKAILDFCHTDSVCPGLLAVSVSSMMQEIADYSLQLPAQICWVYTLDGDLDFVRKTEPYMTAMYRYFQRYETPEGLLDHVNDKWNLVDWPTNFRDGYDFELVKPIGPGLHNVINAFWCGFLASMDELYALLGMPPTGKTEAVKKAFIDAFYNESVGLYCDTPTSTHAAVHSNILPLLFDIGTDDAARTARMIEQIKTKGLGSVGVYMAYFALAALVTHGERELAEQLACDENCWRKMLSEGATTTFEAWGKELKTNTSLCHPWATAPLVVFAKGVRPY